MPGAVAGILWDYYDSTDDDQDGDGIGDAYSIPFSYIWNTIDYDNPTDIVDFYDKLYARYGVDKTRSWEIYWEHGVNLDTTAPSAPSITDYDPSLDTWVQQDYIYIAWSESTDDMSGIKRYLVIVYKDGAYYETYDAGTSTSYTISNLPTGQYDVKVRAEDRAGNTADSSLVGKFMLDTTEPSYANAAPTGTIYDNKSDDIVLSIDWSDVTKPKIVFEAAPPDQSSIIVTYDKGVSWIRWSDITITANELPMVTLDIVYSRADRPPGLSLRGRSSSDTLLYSLLLDISVWMEENKSYTYEGTTYWGTDLGYALQDKITSIFWDKDNYDYLLDRGIRFESSFGLMRLAASPEAEQPPYISRVAKTYAFLLELTI